MCVAAEVVETERWKVKHFPRPTNVCTAWTGSVVKEAQALVDFYEQEFAPDLHEQQAKLAAQIKDAQTRLHRASASLLPHTQFLSEHSRALLKFLKGAQSIANDADDPWIHEVAIRHGAALFLEAKESFLTVLQELFNQTRLCDAETEQQLYRLQVTFFRHLRQSQRVIAAQTDLLAGLELSDAADLHAGTYFSSGSGHVLTTESTHWQQTLADYSLAHDWTLQAAPLDGFLSTLFNYLKSACEDEQPQISATDRPPQQQIQTSVTGRSQLHLQQIQISTTDRLPRLIPEGSLRCGFLMRPSKGLISRAWHTCYAVLQRETRFLHIYKPTFSDAAPGVGHVHVPRPGDSSYSQQTISSLNSLAEQFLHGSHQPGGLDRLLFNPFVSIRIGPDCSVGSDPSLGAFTVKTALEKITLRAFCQEDMVDWVIAIKETIKSRPTCRAATAAVEEEAAAQDQFSDADHVSQFSDAAHLSHLSESPFNSFSPPEPESALYADIEDPWSK